MRPILVDKAGSKQVIYTGALNGYMGALKLTSLVVTGATLCAAPITAYYAKDRLNWSTKGALITGMTIGSLAAFVSSHLLLRRYVFFVNRILPPNPSVPKAIGQERLEFVTLDPWCRLRGKVYSVEHLRTAWDSLGAWRPKHGGSSYILSVESMLASMPRTASEGEGGEKDIVLDIVEHIQSK